MPTCQKSTDQGLLPIKAWNIRLVYYDGAAGTAVSFDYTTERRLVCHRELAMHSLLHKQRSSNRSYLA